MAICWFIGNQQSKYLKLELLTNNLYYSFGASVHVQCFAAGCLISAFTVHSGFGYLNMYNTMRKEEIEERRYTYDEGT